MNAKKLKAKIIERGMTIAEVSDMIGISSSSLYRKLNEYDKITINEAARLKDAVGLTDLEALDIFLS